MVKELQNGADATDLLTDATTGSTDAMDAQAEGMAEAQAILAKYGDDLYELSAAYDEAYEAAYESFSGNLGYLTPHKQMQNPLFQRRKQQ